MAALVAVGAVLAAGAWLYRSPLLSVDRVEVVGASHLSEDRVREIAAVPAGVTVLSVRNSEIEERLRAEPWIAEARVRRRPPHTVRITVEERVPAALIDEGSATLWLVDEEGVVLGERSAEDTSALAVVRDVPGIEAGPGVRLDSDALDNALRVLRGMSAELRAEVRAVSASTVDKTALYTYEDVEIFIGSAEDLERKDLLARRILEEQRGKVVYINVRTVDRPTWRGLETGG
ncbi:MAG: FtsQ-type POTRA domain-containing protein [Coriobacteriia bacterium]|nr:FtsQ-type POTRA domain-containing protein [Coriobacteriia bacterium]